MTDKTFTTRGNESLEARIVAWVLGEASAFEIEELERLCKEQPELAVFKRRIEAVHGLALEAHISKEDGNWKLPSKKRSAIEELIGAQEAVAEDMARDHRVGHSGRRALLAIAACLVLTLVVASVMSPVLLSQKKSAGDSHERSAYYWFAQENPTVDGMSELNTDFADRREAKMAPAKPSASSANVITSSGAFTNSVTIPVPAAQTSPPSLEYGDSAGYGPGWGENGAGGGGAGGGGAGGGGAGGGGAGGAVDEALASPRSLKAEGNHRFREVAESESKPLEPESSISRAPSSSVKRASRGDEQGESARFARSINGRLGANPTPEPGADSLSTPAAIDGKGADSIKRGVSVDAEVDAFAAPDPFSGPEDKAAEEVALAGKSEYAYKLNARPESRPQAPAYVELYKAKGLSDAPTEGGDLESERDARADETAGGQYFYSLGSASEGQLNGAQIGGLKRDLSLLEESEQHQKGKDADDLRTYANGRTQLEKKKLEVVSGSELEALRANLDIAGNRSGDREVRAKEIDGLLNDAYNPARSNPALAPKFAADVAKVNELTNLANSQIELGKYDDAKKSYESTLRQDPYNQEARRGLERIAELKSDYYRAAYDHTRSELLQKVEQAWELDADQDQGELAKREMIRRGLDVKDGRDALKAELADAQKTLEESEKQLERKRIVVTDDEIVAAEEPYSTFSLNINDASFRMAQAALARGEMPDPTGIKVEQFYNAVDYGDPSPAAGQPVSSNIEQTAHPIIPGRNLVRVAIKTASEGRNQGQPLRLTLLIDQSGSMARDDRRQAMVEALEGLRGLLGENDQVNVIGFARTPRLLAEAVKGNEGQLANLVNIEANEGGTNLEEAIKLGQQIAQRNQLEGAQNRMVLFTDGAANLGDADPDSLAGKIKDLRQQGIAFDIAGIVADGLNDELLGEMARHGNGRYYVVGKGEKDRFAQQLAGAFRPAAENVKVQVHFNPERVGRYKLIGFEKDRLNKEDFRNDAVDAAELAAEEAGVAIYQVETLPEGTGEIGEVSVRFRDVASGEMVERGWTIANEIAAPALDQAKPSMQLATLAMMAGEKLKGGPLADAIDFNHMGEVIAKVGQHYKGDPKAAEMLHMIEQLK